MSHGNPYGKAGFPPHEVLRRMMLTLTYGAAPSIAATQPPTLQQAVYDGLDEVQKRKPWLSHKRPERWGALVMSDNTRNFYGRAAGLVEERYLAHVFGAFRTAVEEHLPLTIVNDWNLNRDDLAGYRVLVLANTACLSDAQAAAVERFVRRGGGLVASVDASLFNEFGDPRENFALAPVLGVDHLGAPTSLPPKSAGLEKNFIKALGPDYWARRKNAYQLRLDAGSWLAQGKLAAYLGGEPLVMKGPAVAVAPRGDSTGALGTFRAHEAPNAPEHPAILHRSYGEGRVVYLAAGIDAGYYLYSYPYQRLLLRRAIEWAAGGPPPLRVEAPMCVHSTFYRQSTEAGQRLLVHLFNDVNTTAAHAFPNDDAPLREEVIPIQDVRLTFDSSYRLKRVHLEPCGAELELRRTVGGSSVTVPKLDVHSIVVGELEDAK
jgi:hypothetical protein